MINRILGQRRLRKEARDYERGFAWACVEILGKHKRAEFVVIDARVKKAASTAFATGVQDAINTIEGITEKTSLTADVALRRAIEGIDNKTVQVIKAKRMLDDLPTRIYRNKYGLLTVALLTGHKQIILRNQHVEQVVTRFRLDTD